MNWLEAVVITAGKHPYLWLHLRELSRFLAGASRARQIQHDALLRKLRRHADSDFGRDHGFAEIRSVADFRRRVPVTDYAYYERYLERLKRGEITAMFGPGTRVLMLALTSGTTARYKHIPITGEFFAEFCRGWRLWGTAVYRDHFDLALKKTLKLASNWRQFQTDGGIPCGNISGLVAATAPWVMHCRFILRREVYQIDDPFAKHYTALRLALPCPIVGMVGAANPSTLVEFAKLANARRESLIRDIFDGTLDPAVDLPGPVRAALRRRLRSRHPARARELERIVEQTGSLWPRDYWPQVSQLAVWTGGSVGVYLPQVRELYGPAPLRDPGLIASEARMTIPLQDETSAGVIDFASHYFEFIPVADHGSRSPAVLEAHELETGRDYYILLTTSGGLYRYDIHDVVRCVGFEGEAPVLTFLNKGANFSSITGEKLSEFQVVSAVHRACADLQMPVAEFTLAPVMAERPGYVLLVERSFEDGQRDQLAESVDRRLEELNSEYADKRRSGRLDRLAVRAVPPGTWRALRDERTAERGNFEEYKHPCLVGDLGFAERVLKSKVAVPAR